MKTPTPLLFVLLTAAAACSSGDDDAPASSPDGAPPDDPDPPPDAAEPPPPPDAAPAPAFTLTGDVLGDGVPADAEVVVLWPVSSGSPDYVYAYGGGTSTAAQFTLALADQEPPRLARNQFGAAGVGIGFVILVPTGTEVPEGIVDPNSDVDLLGVSPVPIIWRHGSLGGDYSWTDAFEEDTYQCGHCVQADEGEVFDHFEPIDCSELDITAPPDNIDCNWT